MLMKLTIGELSKPLHKNLLAGIEKFLEILECIQVFFIQYKYLTHENNDTKSLLTSKALYEETFSFKWTHTLLY